MNIKSSIQLIAKLLVILGIPLFLFFYVDSQPTVVESEENEGTREIAIVNEDNGTEVDDEQILLGNEISALLNDEQGHDYKWTVTGRSTADQGFRDRVYDAVIYIPSDFSENAMTFKDFNPQKSELNYVVQPYLDAKDRQRVHREMTQANRAINASISTMYWSHVSQEIKGIRAHFDNILEKEIAFQQAMHSFYAPSSQKIADDIRGHQFVLEGILNDTSSIADTSGDYINTSEEAEQEIAHFANALQEYKEAQQTQQQLLEQFLNDHEEAISQGLNINEEFIKSGMADVDAGYGDQFGQYQSFRDSLSGSFKNLSERIGENKEELKEWKEDSERVYKDSDDLFNNLLIDFSKDYLKQSFEKNNEESLKKLQLSIEQILGANKRIKIGKLIAPEDGETISFRELSRELAQLESDIERVKRALWSGGDEDDEEKYEQTWNPVFSQYSAVEDELNELIDKVDNDQTLSNWKKYASDLQMVIDQLESAENNTIRTTIENIIDNHRLISRLYNELDDELIDQFEQVSNILEERSLDDLLKYKDSLTKHLTVLEQKLIVDEELIAEIIQDNEKVKGHQSEIMKWHNINERFENQLNRLLGVQKEDDDVDQNETDEEPSKDKTKSFTTLVQEAEETLKNQSEYVANHKETTDELLDNILDETNHILSKLREDNAETFEWEESPALSQVNEEIPVHIHESSKTSLENLSNLVQSLHENQERMVTSTSDLQVKVDEVQKESDDLNNRWDQNVHTTELIKSDVYDVLSNTIVDGQFNPYVYNHLTTPVNVEGRVQGSVASQTEERLPPVVLLIIILVTGLLIGFVSNYYSNVTYWIQGALFTLLNIAAALIVSIYSSNIYELSDAQAIQWFILTALVLIVTSNIIRGTLFVHMFLGWLASIALILFFVTPLISIAVPEFSFNNPIADVYLGIQYQLSTPFVTTVVILTMIALLVSLLVYSVQVLQNRRAKVSEDEEMAA